MIDFSDFSNTSSLTLNGNASVVDGILNLTSDSAWQAGSVFFKNPQTIGSDTSFETEFLFRLSGEKGDRGGDGFTFVLQDGSKNQDLALGYSGGNLGLLGHKFRDKSLAIEFDTRQNRKNALFKKDEINDNHIAIVKNGFVQNPLAIGIPSIDLNEGQLLKAWIDYDGINDLLKIFVSDNLLKPTDPILSHQVKLDELIGTEVLAGFTAATSYIPNKHEILNWKLTTFSEPIGSIAIADNNITVNEHEGSATITIVRTGNSNGVASLDYSTEDNTAVSGLDYQTTKGTLEFLSGETTKTISIPVTDDNLAEGDEIVSFAIGNVKGAEFGVPRTALITIIDDDAISSSRVQFSSNTFSVTEDSGIATVTLTRNDLNPNRTVAVDLTTVDQYALAGLDFTSITQKVEFKPGELSKTIEIPILEDTLPEKTESLTLTLNNPQGIQLGLQNSARLEIIDNDPLPSIRTEMLATGLSSATDFAFLPDGRILIAQQNGVVKIFDGQKLLTTPFLNFSAKVNSSEQRGLLSVAVHPDFYNFPYVYLGYTYDPPEVIGKTGKDGPDGAEGKRETRLVRVTADATTNYTSIIRNSEVVLMTIPPAGGYHASGGLGFGLDGSLFYGHGDGSEVVNIISDPGTFLDLNYPWGKLYRIDPITGKGYEDNPFYTGNPDDIQSKVYNFGYRNPFRLAIHPETGEPYVGDVGWHNWEEINTGRGKNFGWPLFEGGIGKSLKTSGYANRPEFQDLYNSNPDVTAPIFARSHRDGAVSITLGDFYTGSNYSELYQGSLFFGDYATGTIEALLFDEEGNPLGTTLFAENIRFLTKLSQGLDSNLYVLKGNSLQKLVPA